MNTAFQDRFAEIEQLKPPAIEFLNSRHNCYVGGNPLETETAATEVRKPRSTQIAISTFYWVHPGEAAFDSGIADNESIANLPPMLKDTAVCYIFLGKPQQFLGTLALSMSGNRVDDIFAFNPRGLEDGYQVDFADLNETCINKYRDLLSVIGR